MSSRNAVTRHLILTAVGAYLCTEVHATVLWDHAFALQSSGGIVNPGVLVGFNPQPEPPARITELSLAYPPDPILVLRDQVNPVGGLQVFDVFLALNVGDVTFSFGEPLEPPGLPAGSSMVSTRATSAAGDIVFDVLFQISSSSGGILAPGSLVGFNPQPEPPAGYGGAFAMSFGIDRLSDAMIGIRILDGQGNPLSLSHVPEPGSLALAGIATAAMMIRRRTGRRAWRDAP